jgi:tetratricopeptide (TPR) repeat protein
METNKKHTEIRTLIDNMQLDEAKTLIDEMISSSQADDITYYLLGNLFRRSNDWKKAIDAYTQAIEINPLSPALSAKEMAISILNFYNTDMYNH